LRGDAERSIVGGADDPAIVADPIAVGFASIVFGGRNRTYASEPAIGRLARAMRIETLFLSPHPKSQNGVKLVGGTKRSLGGRIGGRLDENRRPRHQLPRMRGEMRGVIDALITARLRHARRSGVGAQQARRCRHR
jgi:hypothetical protein